MLGEHLAVVHLVDVIPGEDQHVFRLLAAQQVEVLEHGVGGSFVPVRRDALLRGHELDELVESPVEE